MYNNYVYICMIHACIYVHLCKYMYHCMYVCMYVKNYLLNVMICFDICHKKKASDYTHHGSFCYSQHLTMLTVRWLNKLTTSLQLYYYSPQPYCKTKIIIIVVAHTIIIKQGHSGLFNDMTTALLYDK